MINSPGSVSARAMSVDYKDGNREQLVAPVVYCGRRANLSQLTVAEGDSWMICQQGELWGGVVDSGWIMEGEGFE